MHILFELKHLEPGEDEAWSRRDRNVVKVVALRDTKANKRRGRAVVFNSPYTYTFSDGRMVEIRAATVTLAVARRAAMASDGFDGCDWMIESIMSAGSIDPYKEHHEET
jgi:hypothetical protein